VVTLTLAREAMAGLVIQALLAVMAQPPQLLAQSARRPEPEAAAETKPLLPAAPMAAMAP